VLKKKCLQKSKKLLNLLRNVVFCGVLLCFAQCKRQRPQSLGHRVDPIPLDIPTPIATVLYEHKAAHENSAVYFFEHQYDAFYYIPFYESTMAEVGWHQESCVQGPAETVFTFKKPRKWCTLILEPHKVRFFIGRRKKN